jgi:hypothetical protein
MLDASDRIDESIDLEPAAFLDYLAARLEARNGLLDGLRTGSLIAHAEVKTRVTVPLRPDKDLAADPAVAPYIDDIGVIYADVLEVDLREVIRGGDAKSAKVAWPQDAAVATAVRTPPPGTGFVLIVPAPRTALGKELARGIAGAYATDAERRPLFMPMDLLGELHWWRDVSSKPAATQLSEALAHLASARGRLATPAVEILLRHEAAALPAVRTWLPGATGSGAILARVLLWRSGDKTAADGLDVAGIPHDWLQALGVTVAEADGQRMGILGPARTVPLL